MKGRIVKQRTGKLPTPAPAVTPRVPSIPWPLIGGGLALAVALWFWFTRGQDTPPTPAKPHPVGEQAQGKKGAEQPPREKEPAAKEKDKEKDPGGSFLEEFGKGGQEGDAGKGVLANADLEKSFGALLEIKDGLKALAEQAAAWKDKVNEKELRKALAERERLQGQLDKGLASFDKVLKQARKERPEDAVPQWLTGELLLLVGGEPEEIAPYLTRAVERGVARPRVFASLARVQTQGNQSEEAFRSAAKALDMSPQDRYAWNAFTRAAFNLERFGEVAKRLEQAFPRGLPEWAEPVREGAVAWQARWEAEQKLRLAEEKADDLPRVRLVIEHRRFARDERGVALTKVESTGQGEVVLELFENQAPAAVAQFLTLVEAKKYDATRFYLGEPASLVAGGDPRSKTADPKEDGAGGTGGTGYYIPDEFDRADARRHFRGSISMINDGPSKTGCQFFITVAPKPEMDGVFAVFGRVLHGQEVIDRITRGRTNTEVAPYGRLIPGDLLVRAEVLRKRGHAYKVMKISAK